MVPSMDPTKNHDLVSHLPYGRPISLRVAHGPWTEFDRRAWIWLNLQMTGFVGSMAIQGGV